MSDIPATMRAIRYHAVGGPDVLRLDEIATPQPQAGEVLLRVRASGLNYADIARRYGRYLEPTPLPYIPGSEVAGEIVALGPDVAPQGALQIGAAALALTGSGGYAEYVALPARTVIPLPAGFDMVQAAALPLQGLTAYSILHMSGRMQPGETVLVNAAAGGVGTLAVQLAKLGGAGRVIAAAGSDEKLALARDLGADETINYSTEDIAERVRALTEGKGADVILEPVGGQVFNRSLAALARGGRLVTFGQASGQPGTVDTGRLMTRNASVVGFWLAILPARQMTEGMQALMTTLGEGKLRVIIGGTYPLADAARAQEDLESRRTTGKLVLTLA